MPTTLVRAWMSVLAFAFSLLPRLLPAQPLFSLRADADSPVISRVGQAVIAGNEVLVYDEDEGRIVRLDRTGAVRQRIGGKRSGPGEFLDVRWMGLGVNDSLYVWDGRQRRLSVFTRAGTFVRTEVPEHGLQQPAVFGRLRDGRWLVVTREERTVRESGVDLTQAMLVIGLARRVRDLPTPLLTVPSKKFVSVRVGEHEYRLREVPAVEMSYVAACEHGVLVGSGARREVQGYDATGKLLATIRVARPAGFLTGASRRATIEAGAGLHEEGGGRGSSPALAQAFVKAFEAVIPAQMPSADQFAFGTDRSVWVAPNLGFMTWQLLGRDGASGPSLPFAAQGFLIAATAEYLLAKVHGNDERLELWARPTAFRGATTGLPASLGRCTGALVQ